MTHSVSVQMVGGPDDGKWYSVPSGSKIRVMEPMPLEHYTKAEADPSAIMPETKIVPVRLTSNGYRAYWYERE